MEYSDEELNFFRICYITTNIVTEGLRHVFKEEWNRKYGLVLGDWHDTAKNGHDFYNQETIASRKRNKKLLSTMINGNCKEWDCTALFYSILYSGSIGASSSPPVSPLGKVGSFIDDLREFRNEVFAHVSEGRISNHDFQLLVQRVETPFTGLGLSLSEVRTIANQSDFPTVEVKNLKSQVLQDQKIMTYLQQQNAVLREISDALEEELASEPKSFLDSLPLKPSHIIEERTHEVSMITEQLKELYSCSHGGVTTIYLSGNPGCGKSQLAREVGEIFFKQGSNDKLYFVTTLNAKTLEDMVYSYDSLSRALGCTEYAVSVITTSSGSTAQQKLRQFKTLIAPKMKAFLSWLIIVDGVIDVEAVREFWPASGSKQYGCGQVLVTTQDISGIPDSSPMSRHISLSKGMQPDDAVRLLNNVSQMSNQDTVQDVAKALDYQPLALACAALYIKSVNLRGSFNFNWRKYLDKFEGGKEAEMGKVKKKCESGYSESMPVAVQMALERTIANRRILFHCFQLLSLCAPSPILFDAVVQYVLKRVPNHDEEDICVEIADCSLLMFDSREKTLSFHQVLYRVIKDCESLSISPENALEVVVASVEPIQSMVKEESPRTKVFVEHVGALLDFVISVESANGSFYVDLSKMTKLHDFFVWFTRCAEICRIYGKTSVYKKCLNLVIGFTEETNCMNEKSSLDGKLSSHLLWFCGRALRFLCDYSSALKYLENSLALKRKIHGKNHADVALCLWSLGRVHRELAHNDEAMGCLKEALSINRELFGEKHPQVAHCLNGIALVHWDCGRYDQARQLLEMSLQIHGDFGEKRLAGACHHSLGAVHEKLNNLDVAQAHFQTAFEIEKLFYPEDHPEVKDAAECLDRITRKMTEEETSTPGHSL